MELHCDLDLENNNIIFTQNTPAYNDVPFNKIWLQKDQQFSTYGRNSHICDTTLQNESHWYFSWNFDFYTLVKSIHFPFKWYKIVQICLQVQKLLINESGYRREFHSEKLGWEISFRIQQYYSSYNLKCLKLSWNITFDH